MRIELRDPGGASCNGNDYARLLALEDPETWMLRMFISTSRLLFWTAPFDPLLLAVPMTSWRLPSCTNSLSSRDGDNFGIAVLPPSLLMVAKPADVQGPDEAQEITHWAREKLCAEKVHSM